MTAGEVSAAMGRMVRQVSEGTTKYYWYPGDKREWMRAAMALAAGAGTFTLILLGTRHLLAAVVPASSAVAAIAGANFGRRDARALIDVPRAGEKAHRRAAVARTGRAAWRAVVYGVAGAGTTLVIRNLSDAGFVADWVLPLVPAVVGALAHQAGMHYERLSGSRPEPEKRGGVGTHATPPEPATPPSRAMRPLLEAGPAAPHATPSIKEIPADQGLVHMIRDQSV